MKTLKNILIGMGLTASALGLDGCRTITLKERVYGNAISREEVIDKGQYVQYYFSEIKRCENKLDVKVSKQQTKLQDVNMYDEVPVSEVTYQIKRRANSKGIVFGTGFFYPLANVVLVGIPLVHDAVRVGMLQPEKTMFNQIVTGDSSSGLWGEQAEEMYSYIDKKTKRVISNDLIDKEKRNIRVKENKSTGFNLPAKNLEVKLNNEIKKTDSNGKVVYNIGKQTPVVIETLAEDGKNDRIELK